ncbi:hypothetical protein N657DRAFT_671303 [Parathielavia appendiculata]|uniref:Uncharacterized protein n=1 Tax=Parathielavia appendiculata TaxID=2587402 RepID=A0AAN6U1V4_9PEZI|nr:hypothetical protein N657DRAFT_671303 [Parathielavia appendiculata]
MEFSLRLLLNASPLPTCGPSPQPADSSALTHPFFVPEFQPAFREGPGIARGTQAQVERLVRLVGNDGDLKKLLNDANELCAFQGFDTKTIAVLGESGMGDTRSACTSVGTEYMQRTMKHTAPIEHLSSSALEEVVAELLWNSRHVYLPGVKDQGPSVDNFHQLRPRRNVLMPVADQEESRELLQGMRALNERVREVLRRGALRGV